MTITPHQRWAALRYPLVDAELTGRNLAKPHNELFIISHDALEYVEPADCVSDHQCLVAVIEHDTPPEHFSWPAYGLPVAVALGPLSLAMELRWIQTLRLYQPCEIVTHLHDRHGWHGPYQHDVDDFLELAA